MSIPTLSGQGAIITGGASGICLAFAKQLYEKGCDVLICDLSLRGEAQTWVESLSWSLSPRVRFQRTDVTDWHQLEKAFTTFESLFGRSPTILCPGAGVYDPSVSNFWNDEDENHYKVLRINLEHPIKMSRLAIRRWQQTSSSGTIILISSVGAQGANPWVPLYQVSKHGISAFTRCMARLQDLVDIRVVAVAPGPTSTALLKEESAARLIDWTNDKVSTPLDIAEAMVELGFTQRDRYPAGTVLEVTWPKNLREVKLLNDPGPAPGMWSKKRDNAIKDVQDALMMDRNSANDS